LRSNISGRNAIVATIKAPIKNITRIMEDNALSKDFCTGESAVPFISSRASLRNLKFTIENNTGTKYESCEKWKGR